MAISATTVWEVRSDGSQVNGGGYDSTTPSAGTDYSQQAAAQVALTNISSDGAGTLITDDDAGGLITSALIGNYVYIPATGTFTLGWYRVLTTPSADTFTIDRSAGATKAGGTCNIGGALATLDNTLHNTTMASGNIVWVKAGTYTLTADISGFPAGSSTSQRQIKGYNATRGDNPTGDDRPLIATGTYKWYCYFYYNVENFRVTSVSGSCITYETNVYYRNVKADQTTGNAFAANKNNVYLIDCEATASGTAIQIGNYGSVIGCYVYDCATGIKVGAASVVANSVADTCSSIGIQLQTNSAYAINNTVYNCLTGIDGQSVSGMKIYNNIIHTCTTGILNASDSLKGNYINQNNYHSNTADVTGTTKGGDALALDPEFTDAPNGDFTPSDNMQISPEFPGDLSSQVITLGAIPISAAGSTPSATAHFF